MLVWQVITEGPVRTTTAVRRQSAVPAVRPLPAAPAMPPLRIGPYTFPTPVVLAPMAGVTNEPFRALCRRFGPGLVYVNEMVMVLSLLRANGKTERMVSFGEDEHPRSLQLYGSEPVSVGEAVRRLCDAGRVDHIDLNFGCPAHKVTRRGGGAAVPLKRNLLRSILREAVSAAAPYGVPVTIKFRKGINDALLTYLDTGRIAEDEGVAAIALHARTAEEHYSGKADWNAIGELKNAVGGIPVLGNGDIWEASDALDMVRQTGCDGVVIGRGCLGRPWLFGDLVAAFSGDPLPPPRLLGETACVMAEHARLLCAHLGDDVGIRDFRKHAGWYLVLYPVESEVRRRFAMVGSLAELDDLISELDPTLLPKPGGGRVVRGHRGGPIRVALPQGYLAHLDDDKPPEGDDEEFSGG